MNIVQIKGSEFNLLMPKILPNVKNSILTEARELLVNSDYEAFNIRDLSAKCNISIGTIYNYFPNKRELINAIFQLDWNSALLRMENLNSSYTTLYDKLYKVYIELDNFLHSYLKIFIQIASNSIPYSKPSYISTLYPILDEIISYERLQGTITTKVSTENINKILINILMLPCIDKTLDFQDVFSLLSL